MGSAALAPEGTSLTTTDPAITSPFPKIRCGNTALQTKSEEFTRPLLTQISLVWAGSKEKAVIEKVAQECRAISGPVLVSKVGMVKALRHHSLHRFGRKLKALTGVHNYFVKRPDGTTAAERFFGSKPRNLFEWLLDRVDIPGRPAQKRSQPRLKNFLVPTAT
jgi:hypothetical protein